MTRQRDFQGATKFEPRQVEGRRGGSVTVRPTLADGTWRQPGLPAGRAAAGEPCPVPTWGGAPSGRRLASHLHLAASHSAGTDAGARLRRRRTLALLPVFAALLGLLFASNAGAAAQRNFKEDFGPAEKPSIQEIAGGITIDRSTGDILVATTGGPGQAMIQRFHSDGTPAEFKALRTNVLDGAKANGKSCPEEPASCDVTPNEGLKFERNPQFTFQIAIDESGGVTDGDIYVAMPQLSAVDVFAGDGRYLGQLTTYGGQEYARNLPVGVAIRDDGSVYVSDVNEQINVFVPKQNPVTEADFVGNLAYPANEDPLYRDGGAARRLAFGSGPAAGTLFAAYQRSRCFFTPQGLCSGSGPSGGIYQLDPDTGELLARFDETGFGGESTVVEGSVAINPTNGNVIDGSGREFDVSAGSQPTEVSHLDPATSPVPGLAVDGQDQVILAEGGEATNLSIYEPPAVVPALVLEPAEEVLGTRATLRGTINPAGLPLTGEECRFEYGRVVFKEKLAGIAPEPELVYEKSIACEGAVPPDQSPHQVTATIEGLEPGKPYGFRLSAFNQNGQEVTDSLEFTTIHTVVTEAAGEVTLTSATLNGTVRTEGEALAECFFEYGLATSESLEETVPCEPAAASIAADYRPHKVRAAISDLDRESTYRFRLVATTGGAEGVTRSGEEESFNTFGLPRIVESRASGADQNSVTLEAKINPSGFGTRYRFEWGPTSAYGNVAPLEFEPFIGSGSEPVLVKATVTGLAAATAYHYRVVAESNLGSAQSPDQVVETVNSCGLPEGRCFEEVSRGEAGPVAIPGEGQAKIEMHVQAGTAPGALAYPVEFGYPDATKGAEVLYRGLRTAGGWQSTQLSAPLDVPSEIPLVSQNSKVEWLSDDLSCGFIAANARLTPDPSMNLVRELGGSNLYRINPDGSHSAVTVLPPRTNSTELGLGLYDVAWGSQDCGVTLFASGLAYPGVPAVKAENNYLYEWREGTLRDAGLIPGPEGVEIAESAFAGAGGDAQPLRDTQNTVSADGSRIFFTASRRSSDNSGEINKKAVFVREDGRVTRDVSLSQTGVPDEGAQYQWATPDGSKVFFTANSGLAPGTTGTGEECKSESGDGCELYEYDLDTGELIDRTLTSAAGGVNVRGFLGASADGSRVYFASANRFIPGSGNSRQRNLEDGSLSIYSERDGVISFVGTIAKQDANFALIEQQESWTAQVTPDGRYLLFESKARVTGYDNQGVEEVYLYDSDTEQTTCVSCRQDGRPSEDDRYGGPETRLLQRGILTYNELRAPQFLTEREGQAKVFFNSPDPLAPGAVAGQANIYEWTHDQVFRLAGAPPGYSLNPEFPRASFFAGASADATDVYFISPETLSWEDRDERPSAYDARVGGGFPEPPASPAPCDPAVEGSCLSPSQTAAPQAPATSDASGSKAAQKKKKKHKKKQHHKKKKHQKKKHTNEKRMQHKQKPSDKNKPRRANKDRRTGK